MYLCHSYTGQLTAQIDVWIVLFKISRKEFLVSRESHSCKGKWSNLVKYLTGQKAQQE